MHARARAACHIHPAGTLPDFLQMTRAHLDARVSALQRLLPIPAHKLPTVLARRPEVLARPPRSLAERVVLLAHTLGLPQWTVGSMVAQQPQVLGSGVDVLTRRCVRGHIGMGGCMRSLAVEHAQVRMHPLWARCRVQSASLLDAVLHIAGGAASVACRVHIASPQPRPPAHTAAGPHRLHRLVRAAMGNRAWSNQLKALSPSGLARCLVCSDAAFDRLELLARAPLAPGQRLPKLGVALTAQAAMHRMWLAQYGLLREQGSGSSGV